MATTLQRNKNRTRPKKGAAGRKRRQAEHIRRLVALGMSEDALLKMTAPELRALLNRAPAKAAG